MPFAIYRHEKIKTAGALAASANHMTRAVPTPNADPRRAQMNRVFIGSDDPAADAAALIPALDAVDDAGKKRRRSNSVIAIEVLLTASPEWWADASAEQQQDWLDRSTAWLVQEYGRENIAHLRLHGDERTPHLTGYVVPLDPDTGHLNARRWIGGAARCRQQQTDYAAAVAPLGLSRGIEGSTATHERVRRHYAQISAPVATLEIEVPPRVLLNPDKWADEQVAAIGRQAAPSFARARTAEVIAPPRRRPRRRPIRSAGSVSAPRRHWCSRRLPPTGCGHCRCRTSWTPWAFQQDKAEPDRWKLTGSTSLSPKGRSWEVVRPHRPARARRRH